MRPRLGLHATSGPRARAAPNSAQVWWLGFIVAAVALGCRPPPVGVATPSPPSATPGASGLQAARPPLVLRGAKVMTAAGVIYPRADVVIAAGKIAAVGRELSTPAGAVVIDVTGKTVTPGIIDTHSHIGVYAAPYLNAHADGNEAVAPTTPGVRAADGYWPQDPQIERARAGGVTTMQILPGSANLIGGQSVVVKTYPNVRGVEDARFVGAPTGLKMACGENPKRVYGESGGPSTRMGNLALTRAAFQKAVEYREKWQRYRDKRAKRSAGRKADDKDDKPPPEFDAGLEALANVLTGKVLVHNHCYRADEMSLMLELAREFGFKIRSFHHAVEAYKIADRLAAADTAASVWADWWGFKAEAYDGIRENAALVAHAGARAIIHSDSPYGIQRLNQEAAKAMYAGVHAGIAIDENDALRWITANPAWAIGVEEHVGTLEPGKQADVVVWSASPFSVYAHADKVFIEGELVFERDDSGLRPSDFELGQGGKVAP